MLHGISELVGVSCMKRGGPGMIQPGFSPILLEMGFSITEESVLN